jgi:hypothetical protein
MTFPLPYDRFRWMTEEELAAFDPEKDGGEDDDPDGGQGYILEVDLEYPEHLHLDHHSFPLAPEQIELTEQDLSPYAQNVLREMVGRGEHSASASAATKRKCAEKDSSFLPRHRARKLTSTFNRRIEYAVHSANLKYYLRAGMKLLRIRRGVAFRQRRFIAPYVEMCTRKRQMSKTKAESNIFKLLINSLYGKMIESNDKKMDCRFNFHELQAEKRFRCPTLKGTVICGDDFSVSFHRKREVAMGQSWAVGFGILERSKLIMQKLFYDVIRPAFRNRVTMLMSDTDSFCMLVEDTDVDSAVRKLSPVMDFSNYPPEHELYDASNKNVLGLLKNEVPGSSCIKRFAGVKAKSYMVVTAEEEEIMAKAKGVKTCMKKHLRFADYKRVILGAESHRVTQYGLLAKDYVNRLVRSTKVAFSSLYDQRWLLCAIHTCPYGSRLIRLAAQNNNCPLCANPSLLL